MKRSLLSQRIGSAVRKTADCQLKWTVTCLLRGLEQVPQGLVIDRVMELHLRSLHNVAQVAR